MTALALRARTDDERLVAADHWYEQGRADVAMLLADHLPERKKTRKRVDKMTEAETAAMKAHADKWIKIGLCTDPADRPLAEAAISACYRHAGLTPPRIVWTPAPLVACMAGPIAAALLGSPGAVDGAVDGAVSGAVDGAVSGAVSGAVGGAVNDAVDDAVDDAVHSAVSSAVDGAVHSAVRVVVRIAVDGAVGSAVDDAVHSAVSSAVHSAVDDAVDGAVRVVVGELPASDLKSALSNNWYRYIGAQFWVGYGWGWWGPAAVDFALDVLRLDIGREMELRARAYAALCKSACWIWPHKDFCLVSERPSTLEITDGKLKRVAWKWDGGDSEWCVNG